MLKLRLLTCILAFVTQNVGAQGDRDFSLSKEFFRQRREALRNLMPNNSVAIFFSNPVRNRSNDVDYHYHQDPDFYYLTGLTEPDAVLVIFKKKQDFPQAKNTDELLFIQPKDSKKELWDGKILGKEYVQSELGFEYVFYNSDFAKFPIDFMAFEKVLHFKFHNDVRNNPYNKSDLYDLIEVFKQKTTVTTPTKGSSKEKTTVKQNTDSQILSYLMAYLREIKQPEEIDLLRKAVRISCIGQIEVMKAMHPQMSEMEIQGIHEFVFRKYGAKHEGYGSIIGSGENGCVLHYTENSKPKVSDNLVLMDVGAEYKGYTADVTRTIPANGKFSEEQKIIYEIVLKAQEAAIAICKPGTPFSAPFDVAEKIITEELLKLGIMRDENDFKLYLPHGISHHIGLDVHDRSNYGMHKPNMVITIEPGIYIPEGSSCDKKWWGIAVRIEDDILITEKGNENLSEYAPRKVADIENLMKKPSILNDFVLPELE